MFDYFIVIGLQTKRNDIVLSSLIDKSQQQTILIVHPYEVNRPEFMENLKLWCYPNGIEYYTQSLRPLLQLQQTQNLEDIHQLDQLNHFVLTDEKGIQRFCTSLVYYEKVYVQNKNKHYSKLSKCFPKIGIKQFIRNPLILDEDTQLIYSPKSCVLVSQQPIFDLQRQFLVFFYNSFIIDRGLNRVELQQFHIQQFEMMVLAHGLNGAELEWNQTQIHPWQQEEGNIIVQEKELLEFYISLLFTLERNQESNNEFRVTKFDINNELLRYRTNDSEILSISNFSYRPMFNRLSLTNIMRIVMCIIQEKQMLFFSSKLNEIPQITEALLTLIKPLKWSNIYIPCSHILIWEYANALQPYIMGFDSKHKKFILDQIQDRVVIDLDNDIVTDNDEESIKIPQQFLIDLKNQLNQIATSIKYSQKQKIYQWMEAILKTKKVFLNFILKLLQNVLPYLLTERSQNQNQQTLKNCFDIEGYIQNHPEKQFIEYLVKNTMLFSNFIEKVDDYYTFNRSVDPPIISYVQLMKIQGTKSFDLWKIINQFEEKDIERNLANFQQPTIIDIYQYLIKYYKFQGLYNFKNTMKYTKSFKQIGLHFYDDTNRINTRFALNKKENIFSKFDTRKIVNLNKIFTHQCVNSIVQNYKMPQNHNSQKYDYGPILQKRKTVLRRQSTILQEQIDFEEDNIKIIVEKLEKN